MKQAAAIVLAMGTALAACAPYPATVAQAPPPVLTAAQAHECAMIRGEIARQQTIAAASGVMASLVVEGAARLNASNVIHGLETRAALTGCPV